MAPRVVGHNSEHPANFLKQCNFPLPNLKFLPYIYSYNKEMVSALLNTFHKYQDLILSKLSAKYDIFSF